MALKKGYQKFYRIRAVFAMLYGKESAKTGYWDIIPQICCMKKIVEQNNQIEAIVLS